MILLIRFIGIFMVGMGIMNLVNPVPMKKMISFWRQGKRIYAGGLLRLLFGVAFLLSYPQARRPGVICLLGILFLLGGILLFALGLKRIKAILEWWDKRTDSVLRLIAVLLLLLGALVIYSA